MFLTEGGNWSTIEETPRATEQPKKTPQTHRVER